MQSLNLLNVRPRSWHAQCILPAMCIQAVNCAQGEKAHESCRRKKTVLTGCPAPIDKDALDTLIAKGRADPKVIKTLKCKTVAEGRFRHLNFIRNSPARVGTAREVGQ